jgi:pyruvate carboxylase
VVKKIHKTADFKHTKQMVPVRAGELIVELAPIPSRCQSCQEPMPAPNLRFCPHCGAKQTPPEPEAEPEPEPTEAEKAS